MQSLPEGHGKWQISKHGGALPVWRRDGRELFYRELSRPGGKVFAVPVTTGATFEPGVPEGLFAVSTVGLPYIRRHYTVTTNEQEFLVNVVLDTHPQTILLQNWLPPSGSVITPNGADPEIRHAVRRRPTLAPQNLSPVGGDGLGEIYKACDTRLERAKSPPTSQ